ncbi:unnamed protein product [Brassica oleracea var. botrytis]
MSNSMQSSLARRDKSERRMLMQLKNGLWDVYNI